KLKSLIKVGLGATVCFYGYNFYQGDYRLWSRHVIPMFHLLYPNAESAHIVAITAARFGLVPRLPEDTDIKPYLKTKLWDIEFDNPVGLAAGFDKNGEAIGGLSKFGFGFLEIGTITPEPQKGNLFPRIFRLPKDRAVINRYGFNNYGHDQMEKNLSRQDSIINKQNIIVGLNLGANKLTEDKIQDYIIGLKRFHDKSEIKYFVINISSPNTPNLRNLEGKDQLNKLMDRVLCVKKELEQKNQLRKPLLVKFSPDLNEDQMNDIGKIMLKYSKETKTHSQIDGMIISNTTITRPSDLKSSPKLIKEEGGLSGPPLRQLSTEMIRKMYRLTNGSIPIIGVGGIETGLDAYEKIKAGASMVQLYTSMGPPVVREVKYELAYMLAKDGYQNINEAIGNLLKRQLISYRYRSFRYFIHFCCDSVSNMLSFDNFNVWYYQIPIITGFITTVWLLLKFWRHTREQQIRVIPASWNGIRAHQWSLIQCLTHRATCCLCRSLIVDAMYCDSCGVCLDFQCYDHVTRSKYFNLMKKSEKNSILEPLSHCKRVSISRSKASNQFKHHWVHGNIPSHSKCFICHRYCEDDTDNDEMIGKDGDGDTTMDEHTLYHYRCCWCQRTVHQTCFHKSDSNIRIEADCDFGRYRRLIIPPHYIIHRRVWTTSQSKAIALDEIRDFSREEPEWSPFIVIANRKS
ncbi:dihydroorotate dehydrogenase (quinone), mitochondrial-like protein, partial [Euroglyphus maynei]